MKFHLRVLLLKSIIITCILISCGSDPTESKIDIPIVSTNSMSSITEASAVGGGSIISQGKSEITIKGLCWGTNNPPTLTDNCSSEGSGNGSFSSHLTDLEPNTLYYVRSYATNSIGTGFGDVVSFSTLSNIITDIDGNTYEIVTIGTQVWMKENLKVTHYRNGDPIAHVTDNMVFYNLASGAYCYYNNNISMKNTYGCLYNFKAIADERNIAPEGWHVPSDEEWEILINYLGGSNIAGGKLKETGTTHWNNPNYGATNESGFTALPGGVRGVYGNFMEANMTSYFHSSTAAGSNFTYGRYIEYDNALILRSFDSKQFGFSVRCVKD